MVSIAKDKIETDYNTAINIIGSLKDFNVIYEVVNSYFNQDNSINRALLYLKTEKSRKRVESAITSSFLRFKNQEHKDLIQYTFADTFELNKNFILFWQFALSNKLFLDITKEVFVKMYFSGRVSISREVIIAYLKDFISRNKNLRIKWSEKTITTLATKYLSIMNKLNFIENTRSKTFKYINLPGELLVLFLYFAKLYAPNISNILENDFLSLSFVHPEDIHEKLKKLSLKGFFNMSFSGNKLNIELIHNYNGICDVLHNRS